MKRLLITRRDVLKAGAVIGVVAASPIASRRAVAADQIRKRKNIEDLSADELSAYKHAIQTVKDRSKVNPDDRKGYDYWASLHDLFDESIHSGCAHFSEKFFPWHRRYLFDFEAVLQQSDPPITANVMIPYWDWTRKPKQGVHFPSAFEDAASPLFDVRSNVTPPPWDPEKVRAMVQDQDWSRFAGKPDDSNAFGNHPGLIEAGPHNTLHTNISSDMASADTAVQDPIFWSFHAGIDLCWSRWQRLFVSDSKPQPFVDPAAIILFQDRSFTVASTAKTTDYLYEYDYDFSGDGPPAATLVAEASIISPAKRVTPFAAVAARGRAITLSAATAPASAVLRLADVKVLSDRSYRLDLFLHPKNVDLSSLDADARKTYFMSTLTLWKAHHEGNVELFVRPTPAEAAHLAEGWVVTIESQDAPSHAAARPGATIAPSARSALPGTSDLVGAIEMQER